MISGTMLADQNVSEQLLNHIEPASKTDVGKNPIRVVELFAGIGAQHQALENLGIPHEIVAISEIDKHAIAGYNAIHGEAPNLGDIRKIEHLPECDLITYSFPCQDLSVAGNKKGMAEGSDTRSSLLWEVGRLLHDMAERNILPEVLLMENMDAILNKKNIDQFRKWIMTLNAMGYTSSYAVMNAKDYGIPQNRKRCFMVSTLTFGELMFPSGFPLELRLKDMLEDDVDESYYLSPERIANALNTYRGCGSGTVTNDLRIRYLTPRECLRLMGFDDPSIDTLIEAVPSKTNQYKLAGNSIVVDCLEAIFKAIYIDKTFRGPRPKQVSLFDIPQRPINPILMRSAEDIEREVTELEGIQ